MFTGIVEELGEVRKLIQEGDSTRLVLLGELASQGTGLGDSIAVNGVCLTVTEMEGPRIGFGVAWPRPLAQLPQFRGRFPGFPGTYVSKSALHLGHM